jgi:hypothetical protein
VASGFLWCQPIHARAATVQNKTPPSKLIAKPLCILTAILSLGARRTLPASQRHAELRRSSNSGRNSSCRLIVAALWGARGGYLVISRPPRFGSSGIVHRA